MSNILERLHRIAKEDTPEEIRCPHHERDWWSDNEKIVKEMLQYDDIEFASKLTNDAYFSMRRNAAKYAFKAFIGLYKEFTVESMDIDSFNKLLTYDYISTRIEMVQKYKFTGGVGLPFFLALLTLWHHSDYQKNDKTLTRLFDKYYVKQDYRKPNFFYANFFINGPEHDEELKTSMLNFFKLQKTASDEAILDKLWAHHFNNTKLTDEEWAGLYTHTPQNYLPYQIFYICGRFNIPLPDEIQAFSDLLRKVRLNYDDVTEKLEIMLAIQGIA